MRDTFCKHPWLMLFVLISLVKAETSFSQTAHWDSTYRPDIYKMMVDQFRGAEHSNKDIVFLGNSITFWGNWTERLDNIHVKNRGIPGDITFGVLERLDEIITHHPKKIFILIGINDIARGVPDSIIIQNYKRIISLIQKESPGTRIYFQTILPVNPGIKGMGNYKNKSEHISNINKAIGDLAKDQRVEVLDLYHLFSDAEGNMPIADTWDGVHLTEKGYGIWVAFLKKGRYLN